MPPHFGLPGEKKQKKKKNSEGSGFTWFETTVNGGAVVLSVLKDAAAFAPLPYLRGAAATSLNIIQIAQTVKDNKADFRRLSEDAATLTVVVYESRLRSEDPDGWPGPGLKDPVDSFLSTLNHIAQFAQTQAERTRFIRVMNTVGDGNKIREFRERLAQAMNRFEISAHLQSYEILRLMKNMMEDHKNRLSEQVAVAKEDESNHPLPAVPSDTEFDADEEREEQVSRDGQFAMTLAADEKRKEEEQLAQEAIKKEQETVNEKLQQILRMLENAPEPSPSSQVKSTSRGSRSSSDEENIAKMAMKHAVDKKADRESRRKDLDSILKPPSPPNPYADIAALRAGVSRLKVTSRNSGNVNSSVVYGSHNDNSTVTRISKAK